MSRVGREREERKQNIQQGGAMWRLPSVLHPWRIPGHVLIPPIDK